MRKVYTTVFKQCFRAYLLQTRNTLGLTQRQMSEKLNISERAYANLESGQSCCNTMTFIFFLLSCTDDYSELLEDLRKDFNELHKCIP